MLAALVAGSAVILLCRRIRHKGRAVAALMLVLYILLIYCHTVILREPAESASHNFKLFWSYEAFLSGESPFPTDAVLNLLMLLPAGILFGGACGSRSRARCVSPAAGTSGGSQVGSTNPDAGACDGSRSGSANQSNANSGWLQALYALLLGACISISIETLQFFLHRGFAELDDVLHNTLGCLIGWLLYKGVEWVVRKVCEKAA